MPNPRDDLADKAVEALHQRYSAKPPETVEGKDFREARIENPLRPDNPYKMGYSSLTHLVESAILRDVPDCDERKQALFRLREALMWASTAVLLNDAQVRRDDDPTSPTT